MTDLITPLGTEYRAPPLTAASGMTANVDNASKWLGLTSSVLLIVGVLVTFIVWVSGGSLVSGNQAALESFRAQFIGLQNQYATLQSSLVEIKTRLDNLPRPQDFTSVQQQIVDLGARVTTLEHSDIQTKSDLQHMLDTPRKP